MIFLSTPYPVGELLSFKSLNEFIVTSFPLDVVLVPNNPDEVEPEGEG
jgi:hypothetical protein